MSEAIGEEDGCQPVHETRYRFDDGVTPSEAVIEAVAAVEGVDPTALPPLYGSIDPDALDSLFDGPAEKSPDVLGFGHAGWDVFVRADGAVTVCDTSTGDLP
jgi:hypothetical protein